MLAASAAVGVARVPLASRRSLRDAGTSVPSGRRFDVHPVRYHDARMRGLSDSAHLDRPLAWTATPGDVVACWPGDVPLVALISGDAELTGTGGGSRGDSRGRWSILASPGERVTTLREFELALSRGPGAAAGSVGGAPFRSGWMGWIGYDAGRVIEPHAQRLTGVTPDDRGWPELCMARCAGAYVHDAREGRWFACGESASLPEIDFTLPIGAAGVTVGEFSSDLPREVYEAMVSRAVGHIHAGDVFQVNLARRLSASVSGSCRALFVRAIERMAPGYAALVEGPTPGRAVVSLSPELYIKFDPRDRLVVTKPIKGTAAGSAPLEGLRASEKDRAELAMIVDLMRNDLGRVCEFGSVRVAEAREIERFGSVDPGAGVWHASAKIEGRLRRGSGVIDLLRASFPAGSITGAPKVRAMRIIDEIEPVRRGPYTGAVGFVDDAGGCVFNVAIRTGAVTPTGKSAGGVWANASGVLDYFVGAGVVGDSDPASEWEETNMKSAGFVAAVRSLASAGSAAVMA